MSKIFRFLNNMLKFITYLTIFAIFAGIGGLGLVAWEVFYGDHTELEKSTILARIQEETTLYYLDEDRTIGSFFDSHHRRYIPIDEIPAHMINSIVAAEDKNFYDHFGIDPSAIAKAALEGILSGGRFKRGGSTITQQTVKNIINDWEASFARKFREMIKSLQLERLYTKKQILEFYLNQFHVAGNGNGIGIAAKYYFNKDVKDLNLVEAAFIAGSVKGPGKYNPFIKYTTKTREQAKEFANERKNYVLDRMLEQNWISKQEFAEATNTPVPFNRGEFRSAEVTLTSLIKAQLLKKEVLDALKLRSEEDFNIAGLKVYTTIDYDMQKAAQVAMRKNLSRLETILDGFQTEPEEKYISKRSLVEDDFEFGKITAIQTNPKTKETEIHLSFGLPEGIIPHQSIMRYAKLLDLATGQGEQYYYDQVLKKIKIGDILYVQIMSYDKKTNVATVELQKRPLISGGMIALDKGEVRAVVSGFDTLGFSRAVHAKRQPGSVFKSLAFFGALQLGWSILDRVENVRQIFPYQGKFYFPRPDHQSPYRKVSILWAGVMSENLASVALGARILEKLNYDQFLQLMNHFGFKPLTGESTSDFHYRVAREIGVSLNTEGIREYQLVNTINEISPDLVFAGEEDVLERLKLMWWGNGYLGEVNTLRKRKEDSDMPKSEIRSRLDLLLNNYVRTEKLNEMLQQDWTDLQLAMVQNDHEQVYHDERLGKILERFRVLTSTGKKPELGYFAELSLEEKKDDSNYIHELQELSGRRLSRLDIQAIWGAKEHLNQLIGAAEINVSDVKLNGYLPSSLFETIAKQIEENYQKVLANNDPYMLYRYYQHHDFRIGLGLYFLKKLAKAMGVQNNIDPVLSLPLGTNDVTASEVAKMYQTFVSGKVYRFFDKGADNQINYIRRIEDRDGNILFEPIVQEHQLVREEFAFQMREILRRVITHGTGRRARGELYVSTGKEDGANESEDLKIRIPAFGKTGTTNDYRTSYFAGFIPYPIEAAKPLDPQNSYVISAYVGYDLNKIMKNGRQRIYGGSGALPMWTDFAKKIIQIKKYQEMLDSLDIKVLTNKEWPLAYKEDVVMPYWVDLPRGLVIRGGAKTDIETWQTTDLSQTGETFQDLFAPGSSVQSVVHIPSDAGSSSWQPERLVSLFQAITHKDDSAEQDKQKPVNSSDSIAIKSGDSSSESSDPNFTSEETSESELEENETDYEDNRKSGALTATPKHPSDLPKDHSNEGVW